MYRQGPVGEGAAFVVNYASSQPRAEAVVDSHISAGGGSQSR